jgi:hypothetical protein
MSTGRGIGRRDALRLIGGGLAAASAAGVAGCSWFKDAPPPPDALEPFYQATVDLADRYDAIIAAVPAIADKLSVLRDHHRAHLERLMIVINKKPPSPKPSPAASAVANLPADAAGAFTDLLAAEKAALTDATKGCLAATNPDRATLLGEMAACRATHVEVLT